MNLQTSVPFLATPQPIQSTATPPETTMSRIANIVSSIHSVFENCLGLQLSEFDGDTTFFEMGLSSTVLTPIAVALKKAIGLEITLQQLLEETPTVDSLAEFLDENLPADKFATEPVVAPVTSTAPAGQAPTVAAQLPATPVAVSGATLSVMQEQLRLMAVQLSLLSGIQVGSLPQPTPSAPSPVAPVAQACSPTASKTTPPSAPAKNSPVATVKLNETDLTEAQQRHLEDAIRENVLTLVHEKSHVDELVKAIFDTVVECHRNGFVPGEGYKSVSTEFNADRPPQKGAKIGKDESGNPGWFIPDTINPGQFIQVVVC